MGSSPPPEVQHYGFKIWTTGSQTHALGWKTSWCFTIWPLYTERKGRRRRVISHSTFVGGSFNRQGTLRGFSLVAEECWDFHTHPPESWRCRAALTGFSHVYCSDGLNNILSHGHIPLQERQVERTRERGLLLLGYSSQVNLWSHPLDDLLQHQLLLNL